MPDRKPSRNRLRTMCAEVHPDDGSDPRTFFRKSGRGGKPSHKARQLCRQILETLDSLFAESAADGSLRDLSVVAVDPAPDASHLLVTVTPRPEQAEPDPRILLDDLGRASGWLRAEIARAIRRKRVPSLTYQVRRAIDPDPRVG